MGKSVYGVAKAGVSYMTAALSTEWAPLGVRVNAIAPTTTLTENTSQIMRENEARAKRLLDRIVIGRFARAFRPGGRGPVPGKPRLGLRHRPHAVRRRRLARRRVMPNSATQFARRVESLWRWRLAGVFCFTRTAKPPARRRRHEKPAFMPELHKSYLNIGMPREIRVSSGLHVVHFHRQLRVRLPLA